MSIVNNFVSDCPDLKDCHDIQVQAQEGSGSGTTMNSQETFDLLKTCANDEDRIEYAKSRYYLSPINLIDLRQSCTINPIDLVINPTIVPLKALKYDPSNRRVLQLLKEQHITNGKMFWDNINLDLQEKLHVLLWKFEFQSDKHRVLIDKLHESLSKGELKIIVDKFGIVREGNRTLRAIREYNSTHPGNPLTDIPVYILCETISGQKVPSGDRAFIEGVKKHYSLQQPINVEHDDIEIALSVYDEYRNKSAIKNVKITPNTDDSNDNKSKDAIKDEQKAYELGEACFKWEEYTKDCFDAQGRPKFGLRTTQLKQVMQDTRMLINRIRKMYGKKDLGANCTLEKLVSFGIKQPFLLIATYNDEDIIYWNPNNEREQEDREAQIRKIVEDKNLDSDEQELAEFNKLRDASTNRSLLRHKYKDCHTAFEGEYLKSGWVENLFNLYNSETQSPLQDKEESKTDQEDVNVESIEECGEDDAPLMPGDIVDSENPEDQNVNPHEEAARLLRLNRQLTEAKDTSGQSLVENVQEIVSAWGEIHADIAAKLIADQQTGYRKLNINNENACRIFAYIRVVSDCISSLLEECDKSFDPKVNEAILQELNSKQFKRVMEKMGYGNKDKKEVQ